MQEEVRHVGAVAAEAEGDAALIGAAFQKRQWSVRVAERVAHRIGGGIADVGIARPRKARQLDGRHDLVKVGLAEKVRAPRRQQEGERSAMREGGRRTRQHARIVYGLEMPRGISSRMRLVRCPQLDPQGLSGTSHTAHDHQLRVEVLDGAQDDRSRQIPKHGKDEHGEGDLFTDPPNPTRVGHELGLGWEEGIGPRWRVPRHFKPGEKRSGDLATRIPVVGPEPRKASEKDPTTSARNRRQGDGFEPGALGRELRMPKRVVGEESQETEKGARI